MENLFLGLSAILSVILSYSIYVYVGMREKYKIGLLNLQNITKERDALLGTQIELQDANLKFASLDAKYSGLIDQLESIEAKLAEKQVEVSQYQQKLFAAEKDVSITNNQMEELQKRMRDWEEARKQSLEHAKAAILEAGNSLSNKLLIDHKRETQEAQVNSEQRVKAATEHFQSLLTRVTESVAGLNQKVKDSWEAVDIVKKTLLSPGGAGQLAEITLENLLNNSGLKKSIDYELQFSVKDEDSNYRPDAVIFLPAGNVVIVDCKASKFFVELGEGDPKLLEAKLLNSMYTHLKTLSAKNYRNTVKNYLKDREITHISMIMFLPSETAIEKLQQLDPSFFQKALENDILPTGPVGLLSILALARFHVMENKQYENYQVIIDEVKKLLKSMSLVTEYAEKLGSSVHSSVKAYDRFAGSFNKNLLSKVGNLQKMGLDEQALKKTPLTLTRYQLVTNEMEKFHDMENELIKIEE